MAQSNFFPSRPNLTPQIYAYSDLQYEGQLKVGYVHKRDGSADPLGLKLEEGMTVAVNLDFSARSYPDKNGEIRFENQVRITNIAPFEL